jgi:predicted O-methyltransferase YrrM
LVDLYLECLPEFRNGRIVELGIANGGSTAMIALAAAPTRLVACELESDRVAALDEFIDARGLHQSVRPFYGVDQSDRTRLATIVDEEMGDAEIDLVIDDASHLYAETRASFEVLFPRVRPGGLFIVEDWPAQYRYAHHLATTVRDPDSRQHEDFKARLASALNEGKVRAQPLARLGSELMLAVAQYPDVVASVAINKYWIGVRRGPAPLDRDTFTIDDVYTDYFDWFRA